MKKESSIWPKIEYVEIAVCPCCGVANDYEFTVVTKSSNVGSGGAVWETLCLSCGESNEWRNWLIIR